MKKYIKTLFESEKAIDKGCHRVRYSPCGSLIENKLTGKNLSLKGELVEVWHYSEKVAVVDKVNHRYWTCGTGSKTLQAFLKDCMEYLEEGGYENMDNDSTNWLREYDPNHIAQPLK